MNIISNDVDVSGILRQLKEHDDRLKRIEEYLDTRTVTEQYDKETPVVIHKKQKSLEEIETDEVLEFKIGQSFFAKAGITAFVIGIIFLLTLPLENFPPAVPVLFGFLAAAGFIFLPGLIKKSFPHFHGYLVGGGVALLFFTVLRMYYFADVQLISSKMVELVLLNGVFITGIVVSLKRSSSYIASLAIAIGYSAALVGENPYYIFSSIALVAAVSSYLKIKYKWDSLFTFSIVLGFLTHFLWMMNNPLMGNELKIVSEPGVNILFLFLYFLIYNTAYASKNEAKGESTLKVFNLVLSGFLFYVLLLSTSLSGKNHDYFTIAHFSASVVFLLYSAYFWMRERSKHITFYYAMFGYLALSSAIVFEYNIPNSFVWLCWQSLVVLSTAVWFRSRFIVVANFFIYLFILLLYTSLVKEITLVSLSFGFVPLVSARVLNWQKDRLELKTENMRNSYLLIALLLIPYIFYKMFPAGYVALSWVGVAVIYYVLSNLLKIKKYRWMSLLTFLMTIIYVSLLGLTSSELIYKVVSFLVLGAVLIGISVIYSRAKVKSSLQKEEL
jgi:hypothetical protein